MGAITNNPAAHADATPHTLLERSVLLLVVTVPLALTVWAMTLLWNRLVGWTDVTVLLTFYVLTAMGIGVGFHRMLTHRSFDAHPAVRFFFLALGSMALQGSAIEWAATHNKHHAKSDKEGDPHSPLEGFWTAHLGWLFRDRFIRNGIWAKPYQDDKVAKIIDKTFLVWAVLGFVLPGLMSVALGGSFWLGVLWGGAVRLFLVHHITWSVNSVCHTFGKREFASHDESRNEWVVGLLGLGEGWHNNHHAFPKAAYHGMKWYQFDLNALVIRLLAKMKLVTNVWMPSKEAMESRRVKNVAKGTAAATTLLAAPGGEK
ncbi:MAG TPA: fatty acid desaturase [Candidatus Thermoplasmatota archaeon]|nr:fatty acid desaturase [Candidatus Thermoplasmatota archaeon]